MLKNANFESTFLISIEISMVDKLSYIHLGHGLRQRWMAGLRVSKVWDQRDHNGSVELK